MVDLIIIAGAPGSGKTTICNILKEKLNSPMITFGHIRGFHLDQKWSNTTPIDELMTFNNLQFIIQNYFNNGYRNIIINDLEVHRIEQIPEIYLNKQILIFTLFLNNDQELKERVLTESRDSGFRDYRKSIECNEIIKAKEKLKNEILINNTSKDCMIALNEIIGTINNTR